MRITLLSGLILFASTASVVAASPAFETALFNGEDLHGWVATGCRTVVENGVLRLAGGEGFVRTRGRYADFILELDCALQNSKWDSGIYIRCESPPPGKPWPERYQINLREGAEGNLLGAKGGESSGLIRPGEWNHFKLKVEGDAAELEINGKPAWKASGVEAAEGHIGLQSEVSQGGQFEFKNIRLTELGFVPLTNGRDLAGWHVSSQTGHSAASGNTSGGKWGVEKGAIVGSQDTPGNGGIVLTDEAFDDFEVVVEMNNDFGPDSGLFLRSNDRGQAYQYMVDYHSDGNLAGVYGEGLSGGINVLNFDFLDDPARIAPHESRVPLPVTPEEWPQLWRHGRWNELRARIVGNPPRITTWINGVKFMEFSDSEKRHSDSGSIALQVHGGGDFTKQFVRYRNVRVKRLR